MLSWYWSCSLFLPFFWFGNVLKDFSSGRTGGAWALWPTFQGPRGAKWWEVEMVPSALQYLHSLTRQNPPDLATDLNGVELPHLGLIVWRAGHMSCGSCEIGAGKPMYYQIHVSDFLLLNRYEIWEPCFWELRKACFLDDSKGLHHIFVIGDWGGVAGSWGEERTVMQILLDIVGRY